ncbi:ABC transporter [Colletotrichum graminicola]|uniref:ABC transporter n=1 Tax=Colletotrichum graminicola (strain M1.001 / M2 / FGSC 10212) TaxID=645133 RepID=E3QJP5_COLGM|nr:ABC transporter [Colletotrichum graminicola M1.001]EFQ31083.1 ABC transporter [Colletotrichum graminicola M1.001]WDK10692.1 ABC transporter [Colletotrichum graminicola]
MHLPIALFSLFAASSSILFLILLPHRIWTLRKETVKTVSGQHRSYAKQLLAVLLVAAQLTIVIETLSNPSRPLITALSVTLSFIAYVALFPLLLLEHARSTRPSDLAVIYLLASLVYDAAVLGEQASKNGIMSLTRAEFLPTAISLFVKLCLLITESRGKGKILQVSGTKSSPEQLAGVLSRTFFWWINPILARGHTDILDEDSLPLLDSKLGSRMLRRQALRAWDQRSMPETKLTLPRVLVASLLSPFLAPIVPRLFLIVFRYAQPVLISTVVRYLSTAVDEVSPESGYALIIMAVVVYVGLAISKAVYNHRLNRLQTMVRGAVVGLINRKSLDQQSSGYSDAKAVTLMSTDANGICQSARFFHETWAQVIEVIVGITMLGKEVGWLCPVPLVIIFFCSRMSRYVAKNLQSKQKGWNESTQKRLAMTSSMLSSMKGLKMLGVTAYTESIINSLRLQELDMSSRVRWMMVAYNASANALGIFTPIITFVLFVLIARINGSALDTETAFTTTALLGLVTHPANMIMSIVPQAIGSLAAFERIQLYLLQPPRHDHRQDLEEVDGGSTCMSAAVTIDNVDIQPGPKAPPILTKVSIVVKRASVIVCLGPTGSGKTTLAKAILGEIAPVRGSISVTSKRIGYCDQFPWLPSGTLKSAICGYSSYEPSWYEEVVRLCCLEEDISLLPDGHETMIGSRGLNISGGQRQRVALARAIYARCDIMIFDDAFSALDGKTESRIVWNLLGPDGLCRTMETAVLVISNSASFFHLADELVVLGDNTVKYRGTLDNLPQSPEQILKVNTDAAMNDGKNKEIHADKTLQNQELRVADAISDLSRATGDISLYSYYIKAVGFRKFLTLLACTSCYSFFVTFPQYWLQKWTEAPPSQTNFYVGGYLIASLLAWVSTNGSMWSTHILIAPRSGAELHRRLISTVTGASLGFFSTTNTGVILNRFSQDLELIDRQLPPAILALSNQVSKLIVQTTLLFSAQKFMSLTLPFCLAIVYLIQRVYLRTSRQLRLLDLEAQSAVYSSFLESDEGIITIRAFSWQNKIEDMNISSLDKSQQPAYTLLCLQQWLGLVLDLLVAAIATILIVLALMLRGSTTAGQIGMAMNLVLFANTTLLGLVTSWTNMEISLGAISRLKDLEAKTPREDKPCESYSPVDAWPSSGIVECDDISVAYKPGILALKNVTIKVSSGQKLVVCGRTGSGKSTLLLTLLRLLDTTSGRIKVDGLDISLIPRSLIRERCFITIPQDPFVFGQATLRFNLDLAASLPDEDIAAALQRAGLWSHFTYGRPNLSPTETKSILDKTMADLPGMSAGQMQLFALARALVRLQVLNPRQSPSDAALSRPHRMPVLLLDEATSSLDPETEAVMQKVLHQDFTKRGHTVIAITHRLSGVTKNMHPDQDMVAILSEGRLKMVGRAQEFIGDISI